MGYLLPFQAITLQVLTMNAISSTSQNAYICGSSGEAVGEGASTGRHIRRDERPRKVGIGWDLFVWLVAGADLFREKSVAGRLIC
jgi:hypothetical protein